MEGLSEIVFLVKTRLRPTGAPPPPEDRGCPVMLASHSTVGKGLVWGRLGGHRPLSSRPRWWLALHHTHSCVHTPRGKH